MKVIISGHKCSFRGGGYVVCFFVEDDITKLPQTMRRGMGKNPGKILNKQ